MLHGVDTYSESKQYGGWAFTWEVGIYVSRAQEKRGCGNLPESDRFHKSSMFIIIIIILYLSYHESEGKRSIHYKYYYIECIKCHAMRV